MPLSPVVVLTNWVHPEVLSHLRENLGQGCEVVANDSQEPLPPGELASRMARADAMMAFMTDCVDDAFLREAPKLKVIACALKGADNFDIDACMRHRVTVTFVPDLLTVPTAELTVGLTIGLARNLRHGDAMVRSGQFVGWKPVLYGSGLAGATLGVVGQGAVGRALVAPFAALGATVLAFDERPLEPESCTPARIVGLPDLLANSDVVVLALPLNQHTDGLFNASMLAAMKPGALLVNPARGSIVDESAVASALESGHLGGYAADVFAFEDWAKPDRPKTIPPRLLAHHATFFTPHLGSAVDDVRRAIAMSAAQDIIDVLAGRSSPNTLTSPATADMSHA
ncbi:MAG: NAD(P)-dependent oxidoreductase [Phreatobacter sp.]|uniref:NAD(P)-dependent oxidoreductase n=1 Tax=Phreatobacter sp. TaxID=1966341 RepID=UPI002735C38E|nr:NAD(P)-dependent oxidoreductase [Phreatobacter sp.]MDP2802458.1 NAD(P)-dependent oxidoreductase [Phreatobacter sp.]